MSTWSEGAWKAITPVFEAITRHPFLVGLTDGSLDQGKFRFYLSQDALYLDDFGRVLAGIGAKCRDKAWMEAFLGFSTDTMLVERELHRSYLDSDDARPPASPACLLYTSYMHRQLATRPLPVAVASVLPCFWVYQEVGNHILAQPSVPGNPFQAWIDTYGGEEYGKAVRDAIAIADSMASAATAPIREEMTEAFVTATKMEWMFWDSAWRDEAWPV